MGPDHTSADVAFDRSELFDAYRVERPPAERRPWVVANMVAGLDGSATVGGRVGVLSGPVDREVFAFIRSLVDVVLVGASTVRAERYGPVRLTDEQRRSRRAASRPELPTLAVVSLSLAFDWTLPLFSSPDGPRPLLITAAAAGDAAIERAQEHAEVIVAGDDVVDLAQALAALRQRGATTVLTEGGPTVLGELIAASLVDELCLTLAPAMGGDPLPIVVWPAASRPSPRFSLASVCEASGHLFLRYLVNPS